MNFKYLMTAALALTVGLASCSNDDDTVVPGQGGNGTAQLDVVLVDGGSKTTYAAPAGATDPALPIESTITSGNLYIFNTTTLLLEATVAYPTLSTPLTIGPKTVYFVGNGTVTPAPVVGTTTIAAFAASQFALATPVIGDLTTANNFYISNIGTAAQTINVAANATTNLALNIGRGVAKVNIEFPAIAIQPATGTLSGTSYIVRNNPGEMFNTPVYNLGELSSPYFANATGAANYFDNGTVNVVGPWANPTAITITGLITADGNTSSYASENAIAAPTFGTFTYALIRGSFVPNTVYNATGAATVYTAGTDFYRIQYVEAVGVANHNRGFTGKFYTAAPNATEIAAAGAPPAPAHGGTVTATVVKYIGDTAVGAYCYYYHAIGDNTKATPSAKMAVERNLYYYYIVKSISDCGHSTPTPVGPTTPVTTENLLNVNFVTAPWGVVGGGNGIDSGI